MKILKLIQEINSKFMLFWDPYFNEYPIFFDQNLLNFKNSDVTSYGGVLLAMPSIQGASRTSLGNTYNSKTDLLYVLRIYSKLDNGIETHEALKERCVHFFSSLNLSVGYESGNIQTIGPAQLDLLQSYSITNVSRVFSVNETISLS